MTDVQAPSHLDGGEHGDQDPGEHERVHEPGRPEQQGEPDDVHRLEEEERRAHEEQVEVGEHPADRSRRDADGARGSHEDQDQRGCVVGRHAR